MNWGFYREVTRELLQPTSTLSTRSTATWPTKVSTLHSLTVWSGLREVILTTLRHVLFHGGGAVFPNPVFIKSLWKTQQYILKYKLYRYLFGEFDFKCLSMQCKTWTGDFVFMLQLWKCTETVWEEHLKKR